MLRGLLDGLTGRNRREIQALPKLDLDSRFIAEAMCDANVCSLTPSLFPAYGGCPGSLLPLGPPHPTRSSHHRIFIALGSGRISLNSSTSSNNDSTDGVVTWRLRSSRSYSPHSRSRRSRSSRRRRAHNSQASSHSHHRPSNVRLTAPSLSSRPDSLTPNSLLSLSEIPRRSTVVKFTNDIQAKVELRKQSSQHVLYVSAEESKFGSLSFSYVPQRRFSIRAEGHQSWLGLSRTRFFPSLPRIFFKRFHKQPPSYAEALTISSSGRVVPVPLTIDHEQQSSQSQSSQVDESPTTPLCMRLEAEYAFKDNRWVFYTGVEGDRRELSAKLVASPPRVSPRFQIPMSGNQNRGWIRWTCGEQTFLGEVAFGWRTFTLTHDWPGKSLHLSRSLPSGSGLNLYLDDKRMVKVDSTYISKMLKSRFSLAVNTTMANKKQLCSATVALSNSIGSLSAYAKPDRSYGLALESDFSIKAHTYRIAVKADNLKCLSLRLGLFY